jgi:hypothetical protein
VVAIELADEVDQPVHRLEIALPHARMGDDHRVAKPGDLQLHETDELIDLALGQHLGDDLSRAADGDVFHTGHISNRDAGRQPLEDAQLALRRRRPRRAAPGGRQRRRRLGGAGFLRALRHGARSGGGGARAARIARISFFRKMKCAGF